MAEREPNNIVKDVVKTEAMVLLLAAVVFCILGLVFRRG